MGGEIFLGHTSSGFLVAMALVLDLGSKDLASSFTPQNVHTSFLPRLKRREQSGQKRFKRSLKLHYFHRTTIWRCLSTRRGMTRLHFSTDDSDISSQIDRPLLLPNRIGSLID